GFAPPPAHDSSPAAREAAASLIRVLEGRYIRTPGGSAAVTTETETTMPEHIFRLDSSKRFVDQEKLGHNRWHPEIPPVATVKPGDSFRVDCREWFDGAIKNDDSAQDILEAPLLTVHTLSGPFRVEGAKPGDLLIVDILDVGPI